MPVSSTSLTPGSGGRSTVTFTVPASASVVVPAPSSRKSVSIGSLRANTSPVKRLIPSARARSASWCSSPLFDAASLGAIDDGDPNLGARRLLRRSHAARDTDDVACRPIFDYERFVVVVMIDLGEIGKRVSAEMRATGEASSVARFRTQLFEGCFQCLLIGRRDGSDLRRSHPSTARRLGNWSSPPGKLAPPDRVTGAALARAPCGGRMPRNSWAFFDEDAAATRTPASLTAMMNRRRRDRRRSRRPRSAAPPSLACDRRTRRRDRRHRHPGHGSTPGRRAHRSFRGLPDISCS